MAPLREVEIVQASDRSLLVRCGAHERVVALARALERDAPAGVTSFSPAYDSVLVRHDPCLETGGLRSWLASHGSDALPDSRRHVLPVVFDGPDLVEGLVEIFCATEYRVYFLGFVPGFAYMGEVDERIALPRRPVPRAKVPAGSVGIAGRQTGVYPLETPGGWNLIGRCLEPVFRPDLHPPCLFAPGDRVRFEPA